MLSNSSCLPRRTVLFALGIVLALASAAPAQILTSRPHGHKVAVRHGFGLGPETRAKEEKPLPIMNVGDCIRVAHDRQPRLAAMRASLSSAQLGQNAVDNTRLIGQMSPEIKYRKQQAANGVLAASAELDQTTHEVTQAVVWTYYSVVYAREQVKVASDAVDFVDFYREQVDKIVNDKKGGNREINQITLNRLVSRLADGKRLMIRAQAGYDKARAALREAMGVDPTYLFEVADPELPGLPVTEIKRDFVIAHAQSNRGEVMMASLAVDVTRLEACIQWSYRFRLRTDTYAGSADIHARPIPTGTREGGYRPNALGPEMPARLFGNRYERSQKVTELAARSHAVLENTKNLVALEAENAFIDYYRAGETMVVAKEAATASKKTLDSLKEVAGEKISTYATLQSLLEAKAEEAMARASYNEAVYHRIEALASIERVTAGGYTINYPGRSAIKK